MKNKLIMILAVCAAAALTLLLVFAAFGGGNAPPAPGPDTGEVVDAAEGTDGSAQSPDESSFPEEPAPPVPPIEIKRVSFAAVGDNLIHSSVFEDAKLLAAGTDMTYDFTPMYEKVRGVIEKADIAFVNQEGPVAGKSFGYSGYPMFNAPDEAGQALIDVGFDVINLANNHMLDKGESGYAGTVDFWRDKPVVTIGGHLTEQDYNAIRTVEKNGVSIAFLSYTYGTNGLVLPAQSPYYIPLIDKDEIERQIKEAKALADLVCVSIHWGAEDQFQPNAEQRTLAEAIVDSGADVILGHHPHVLQPLEWRERADGTRALIAYSLGNFLSTMMYGRNMVGGILTFEIVKIGQGRASVENAAFLPTVTHYNRSIRGLKIYPFSEYTEELELAHGTHRYGNSMSMSGMRDIIRNAIPEEFIKQGHDSIFKTENRD